jgi:hypothetical protein
MDAKQTDLLHAFGLAVLATGAGRESSRVARKNARTGIAASRTMVVA